MNDNNIYTITIFPESDIYHDHKFSIYCNNFNFQQTFYSYDAKLIFEPIIVPKYINLIYLQVSSASDNFIFYINNDTSNFRISVGKDKFIIKLRQTAEMNYLSLPNNNFLDTSNKYIYHQKLKTLIPEQIDTKWNGYIKFASFSGANVSLRKYITEFAGIFLKSSFSKFLITDFIKKYNINFNKYNNIEYESFNDFFTRRLIILPDVIDSNNIIRSPCTSRSMVYSSIDQDNFTSWIKGTEFTIDKLIGTASIKISSMLINRLAVQDYHHFHMPCSGTLENITILGSDYHSVSPSIINTPINVFTENYRHIYQFKETDGNVFFIVAIGALIIGSIEHKMTIGNTYKSGDRIGNFAIGGSTIVVLFQKSIYFDPDLTYYSNMNIESYVKVGDEIGSTLTSRNITYPQHYHIKNYDGILNVNEKSAELIKIIFVMAILIVFLKMFVFK